VNTVQSKNKPAPRAAERRHIERIKEMNCGLCDERGPSDCHEIKQGQWFTSIPLCRDCHMGPLNGLHGRKTMWSVMKMDEMDVLASTIEKLYGGGR
jgi:hypothetical protein